MAFNYLGLLTALLATTAGIAHASTTQCCSSVIPSSSPAVDGILALMGFAIPPPSGQIGVCCKPVQSSCDSCDGKIISCPATSHSVLGIDIGVGCTATPPCTPCNTVGITTSPVFGDNTTGNAFNDLVTLTGNSSITTDNVPTIKAITFRFGSVLDGIAVTYAEGSSQTVTTIEHGTSLTASGPTNRTLTLGVNETITSVAGQSGFHTTFGVRVLQIQFAIFDASTGSSRISGPFGTASSTPFNVTVNGTLVALGGFANNTNSSLATLNGRPGGLYGLSFITSTGLNCPTDA